MIAAAPVDSFQMSVVLSGRLTALSAGTLSVGTPGSATTVEKLKGGENALVPPMFVALTLQ